jgi:hypothetical protein
MSHKKKIHPLSHKPFTGSVELIPPHPMFIEFIDAERLWGFPMNQIIEFVLEDLPEPRGRKILPPHQLTLTFPTARIVLRGWRLELMISPLISGHIARVHAENLLGPLVIEEAWVSEIHVHPVITTNNTATAEPPAKP